LGYEAPQTAKKLSYFFIFTALTYLIPATTPFVQPFFVLSPYRFFSGFYIVPSCNWFLPEISQSSFFTACHALFILQYHFAVQPQFSARNLFQEKLIKIATTEMMDDRD